MKRQKSLSSLYLVESTVPRTHIIFFWVVVITDALWLLSILTGRRPVTTINWEFWMWTIFGLCCAYIMHDDVTKWRNAQ